MRKVMLWANRNGLMYVLDRTTGEFLQGKPFVKVNWMDGFDAKGRPQRVPGKLPGAAGDGTPIMPTVLGATNWYPPSYSPKTGLFYVSAWENSKSGGGGSARRRQHHADGATWRWRQNVKTEEEGYGVVRAFDPRTLDQKWEFKMNDITWAGVLSTAGDVVFSGGREGYFFALDGRNGKLLWKVAARRPGQQRPHELRRQRPAIHRRRRRHVAVLVRAAAVECGGALPLLGLCRLCTTGGVAEIGEIGGLCTTGSVWPPWPLLA